MSTPALRHHLLLHTMHAQGRRVHDGTGEMHEGATWRRLPQRLLSCPQTSAIDPSVDVLLLRQRQPVELPPLTPLWEGVHRGKNSLRARRAIVSD